MGLNAAVGWLKHGVVGLLGGALFAAGGEARATDCPAGFENVDDGCRHPSATVGPGVALGPGSTIANGATVGRGAHIKAGAYVAGTVEAGAVVGKDSVVEVGATVGANAKLGPKNHVGPGAKVKPATRSGRGWVFVVAGGKDETVVHRSRSRLTIGATRSSLLRPSAAGRLASPSWPIDHGSMWTAWCDTPTTGAFNPRGPRWLSVANGRTQESGVQHRRVFTVCVDIAEDGSAHIMPSPANRWPRALSFQSIEVLSRQEGDAAILIEVDGEPAIEGAVALGVDEVVAAWMALSQRGEREVAAAAEQLIETGDLAEALDEVTNLELKARLAVAADQAPSYRRHYSTTFAEGTVTVRAGPRGVDGTEVGTTVEALAMNPKVDKEEAIELASLAARLKLQEDLAPDSVEAVHDALEGEDVDEVLKAGETLAAVSPTEQSIQVEDVYNLSLFTGLGIVTGDARSGAWEIVEVDGARTVQSDGNSYIDPELVLGATLFFGRKPRTYTGFDVGITAALGAVSLDSGGVDLFRSAYLGPTIGWRHLALTPSLAIKRGAHLRDGAAIGMAVADSATTVDVFTEERFGFGFGLMLTLPLALVDGFSGASSNNNDDGGGVE